MYDAIDPYTYENSTVLVNKLDLREQTELDAFEAEISSARADEPTLLTTHGLNGSFRHPMSKLMRTC
jgi:predicted alpha/beta-fold hydrolase